MRRSQPRDKHTALTLPEGYRRLQESFRWQVPEVFNIAEVCCHRWARQTDTAQRVAVRTFASVPAVPAAAQATAVGRAAAGRSAAQAPTPPDSEHLTYAQLHTQAARLSQVLQRLGVVRGDRVAVVMPQCVETAVAYVAILQMGAVAMPLSLLFGPDALAYRLQDSEAVVAIAHASALEHLQAVRAQCPLLRAVLGVGSVAQTSGAADLNFDQQLRQSTATFSQVQTRAEEPAVLIYTSGTTGNPKGALIPHRALIGNLSGFVCSQNWFGFDGVDNAASDAVFWSPADWAWTGGLMDALLPTLYFGRTIVALAERFTPQLALELMGQCAVTHTFLFPTAIKAMMKAYPGQPGQTVQQQFGLRLQACMSAGEAMGDAVFDYCVRQLGVVPNEMFGQTEINYIVGNFAATEGRGGGSRLADTMGWQAKPGSMGLGYPGHRVAVIDDDGRECPVGVPGDVALHRYDIHGDPDPVFFLGYWKNEAATRAKFTGDWCRTGDIAVRDADGYLWYQGRADDVFKSSGYRIGPGEIENCLVKHPSVANAAVVPKPDPERGALVKAYVVVAPHAIEACQGNADALRTLHADLTRALQEHVRELLAPYEYPKEIEYVDALPMTTTGKVQRRVLRLQEEARAQAQAQARAQGPV